jgi:DNA-binding NtrC family response regulator
MDAERFREDLYYRLNVFPIALPPLRARPEDLPLLIDHFVRQVAPSLGIAAPRFDEQAMAALLAYEWPGNIRELRNVVERCALLAEGHDVTVAQLPPEIARQVLPAESAGPPADSKLAAQERATILQALGQADWNQSAAARILGISRDLLRYRVKKHQLKRP